MNIEYEIIGNTICVTTFPFDKSAGMYSRSTHIGNADDGWSEIVKIDDKYYRAYIHESSKNNIHRNFRLI